MKAGIVGLPNVGKSTLFNCLSNAKAQSANFPFCTIEPNIGVVNVPDTRLEKLSTLVNPQQVIPATVEIVDIAGLVKGASKGEGLGNQFLGNIRETDAILHVLRCFDNDNVVHVDGSVDPIRDKETIDMELQLKDLESVEKKLDKVKRAAKTGNKEAQKEADVLNTLKEGLEAGTSVRAIPVADELYADFVKPLQLITDKPVMYVCNVDEEGAVDGNAYVEKVKEAVKEVTEEAELKRKAEAELKRLKRKRKKTTSSTASASKAGSASGSTSKVKRFCSNPDCGKDISDKRKTAKYCGTPCRNAVNNSKR